MAGWNGLLEQVELTPRSPLRLQMVIRALSDLIADDAVISLDCSANTHFAARCIKLRANQRFTGTGMLASMAPQYSIIAAGVLLSPALAFLLALAVAMVIGLLKDAGAPVAVAIAAGSIIGYFLVRRMRAAPGRA